MRQGQRWLDPVESVLAKRIALEDRRTDRKGMDCRTNVVDEAGQCQLRRVRSAADHCLGFNHRRMNTGAREFNRRAQAIRSGADHIRTLCFD